MKIGLGVLLGLLLAFSAMANAPQDDYTKQGTPEKKGVLLSMLETSGSYIVFQPLGGGIIFIPKSEATYSMLDEGSITLPPSRPTQPPYWAENVEIYKEVDGELVSVTGDEAEAVKAILENEQLATAPGSICAKLGWPPWCRDSRINL